jgi:2'-5' RNA ligase
MSYGRRPAEGGRRPFSRPQDDPPGTSRLFVAVPLADDVRDAVGQLMERLAGAPIDVRGPGQPRWVRVDGLHLPTPQHPRVLWIGIGQGEPQLVALARRLNVELQLLGWPSDDRPLQAHLTLARTDGVPGSDEKARRLIDLAKDVRLGWLADSLVLYKSHVDRGPTHYEALVEARLGTG